MNRRRFILLGIVGLLIYLVIIVRLFYLQVIKGKFYTELSKRNYIRKRILYPQRGEILDRRGEKLAYDIPKYMLVLDHQKLQEEGNLKEVLENLKNFFNIEISHESLRKRKSIEPIVLAELKSQEEIDRFYNYSYKFPGVFINTIPSRTYPYGEICPHVLGYVGYPTENHLKKYGDIIGPQSLVGMYGIEKDFDSELLGKVGKEEVMIDATGKVVGIVGKEEPEKGNTLVLSIDGRIQRIAYEVFRDSGYKVGAVLILNAKSGEVLALLSYPSFDPNNIYDLWNQYVENDLKPLFNRATNGKYPPASVIKAALGIGLLEKGVSPLLWSFTKSSAGSITFSPIVAPLFRPFTLYGILEIITFFSLPTLPLELMGKVILFVVGIFSYFDLEVGIPLNLTKSFFISGLGALFMYLKTPPKAGH